MKRNYNIWYLGALVIIAMPSVHGMHEAEGDYDTTTSSDDSGAQEREELRQRLQRSRTMPEHDWAYTAKPRSVDTSNTQSSAAQPETRRVQFANKTWTQKISDFFSNIFGKKAILDDRLLTHNARSGSGSRTEDALTTAQDKALFKSLSEDQQEKSLNNWLSAEKNKLQSKQEDNEDVYNSDVAQLEKSKKDTKTANEKLIQQSNKASDNLSTVIRKFKNNYPDTDAATLRALLKVNNEILAVRAKDNDLATNRTKQAAVQAAVETVLSLYEAKAQALSDSISHASSRTKTQLTKELQSIRTDIATLKTSLQEIQKNDITIRRNLEKLRQLQEKVQKDNLTRKINTQEAFNRRLIHFRNEIQTLLPANRVLKYNQQTGEFEYHTATTGSPRAVQSNEDISVTAFNMEPDVSTHLAVEPETGDIQHIATQIANYDNLSQAQKIQTMTNALENYESLTPEQQEFVRTSIMKKDSGFYANLPNDLQQKYISLMNKEYGRRRTQDPQTTAEQSIPQESHVQPNTVSQAEETFHQDLSRASQPARQEAQSFATRLYEDIERKQPKTPKSYDELLNTFVRKEEPVTNTTTPPEQAEATRLDNDAVQAFEAIEDAPATAGHIGASPTDDDDDLFNAPITPKTQEEIEEEQFKALLASMK